MLQGSSTERLKLMLSVLPPSEHQRVIMQFEQLDDEEKEIFLNQLQMHAMMDPNSYL